MTDRLVVYISLLVMGIVLALPARAQTDAVPSDVEQSAREGAQEWLELLDEADYEESWEEAAPVFRERVEAELWEENSKLMVDSIGTPSARNLTSIQYQDSIRTVDAAGPFVIVTYRTRFPGGHFEEMLVMIEDEDGWRVAGYQAHPLRSSDPTMPVRRPDEPQR